MFSRATLKWVNSIREEKGVPPLKKMPPGTPRHARSCRIANAFLDLQGATSIGSDYEDYVAGKPMYIPLRARIYATFGFDLSPFQFLHIDKEFSKKKLETLYKKPKKPKIKAIKAEKIMTMTDEKFLDIEAQMLNIQNQINGIQLSFEATAEDHRKRLRTLEDSLRELKEMKRTAENEIYS